MDPLGFCSQTRVLIVAGKGGVGKTTASAALARMAASMGLTALLVEVEGKGGISAAFGAPPLRYGEAVVAPAAAPGEAEVRARTLTPDDALIEYLEDHGLARVGRRLSSSGVLEVVATAIPGVKDILVLGKVKSLERSAAADLIVVDAPAAGHAVSFLLAARGLLDAARVGPIRTQAQDVADLLADPARCRVLLVTLAEETPVNEVVETAYRLEDRVGVALAGVVVNGCLDPVAGLAADPAEVAAASGVDLDPALAGSLRAAAEFRRRRTELQEEQIARLAAALPLPQLRLPWLGAEPVGRAAVDRLAASLAGAIRDVPPEESR